MSIVRDTSIQHITGDATSKHGSAAETPILGKRKRDDSGSDASQWKAFEIKPDVSEPLAKPRIFVPLCLIPRAQLPLSYLDSSQTGPRTFSARLSLLEHVVDVQSEAMVLIAESQTEKKLYAMEKVQRHVFVLCKLCNWVNLELLQGHSHSDQYHKSNGLARSLSETRDPKDWWKAASVDVSLATDGNREWPRKASRLSMLDARSCESDALSNTAEPAPHAVPALNDVPEDVGVVGIAPTAAPTSVDEILSELIHQYLDALYISRTSLAYFAKGPLSRARAAFTSRQGLDIAELTGAFRAIVHSSSTMDRKYREKVPGIIKELPTTPTPEKCLDKSSKKKSKKKLKPDKYGMLAEESEYLKRWWHTDESSSAASSMENAEVAIRRRVPQARNRETFLQILIILEVLALERASQNLAARKSKWPSITPESQLQNGAETTEVKKKKAKKQQDLIAALDTLVDRLCIWHSLEQETHGSKKCGEGQADRQNELHNFCIEVIIPFYMSRVPEVAANVNKKLGGPSAPTPIKRKPIGIIKPDEPTARQPAEKKARKALQRVSTETLLHATTCRQAPSLHRAATDSQVLGQIKRETSETPLSAIPPKPKPRPLSGRESLLHSMPLSKREVDLSAMSQATEARMRKKAEVEEKLREAITTLKKPNRALAVKDMAESADLGHAKATGKAKSGQVVKARSHGAGVFVAATPKSGKAVRCTRHRNGEATGPQTSRSSGTSLVPSSTAKQLGAPASVPGSSLEVPATGHGARHGAVQDTPSRGFAKFMPPGLVHQPGSLDSPVASRSQLVHPDLASAGVERSSAVQATPSKPPKTWSLARSPGRKVTMRGTVVPGSLLRPAPVPLVGASSNVIRSAPAVVRVKKGAGSIYEALGWNDDSDDDVA